MHESSPLGYLDQQLAQRHQVKVKTCADVYNYWRTYKRLYKKAPKDGVEFQIEYIDTGSALSEELRATAPIAVALHGAPGSYHDFALLIQHLSKQGVRVIAPNFPEYVATVKTKVLFRHSADEKAAYLRDFLKAIQVTRIDLLISHSSAMFPTLLILLNANEQAIARRQQQAAAAASAAAAPAPEAAKAPAAGQSRCTITEEPEQPVKGTVDRNNNDTAVVQSNTDDSNSIKDQPQSKIDESPAVAMSKHRRRHQRQQQQHRANSTSRRPAQNGAAGADDDVIVKFEQPIEIKAVALFNPAGHRLPKSMKPTWFKCGSVRIYQHKLGRSLFGKLGPAFLTIVGVPVKVNNMDNVMLSATVMRNSKCHRVVSQLERLSQMRLPTLLVFSESDKLIEKEIFYEMTQFMQLDRQKFDVFENETMASVVSKPAAPSANNNNEAAVAATDRQEDWIRVMVFKAGGHYTYSNYSKIVNEAVSGLLSKVTPANKPKDDDDVDNKSS